MEDGEHILRLEMADHLEDVARWVGSEHQNFWRLSSLEVIVGVEREGDRVSD